MNQESEPEEEVKHIIELQPTSEKKNKKKFSTRQDSSFVISKQERLHKSHLPEELSPGFTDLQAPDQPMTRLQPRVTPALRNSFSSQNGSIIESKNRSNSQIHQANAPRVVKVGSAAKRQSGNLKELLQRIPSGNNRQHEERPSLPAVMTRTKSQMAVDSPFIAKSPSIKVEPKPIQFIERAESMPLSIQKQPSGHSKQQRHSRLDNNALKHAFKTFQQTFESEVDFYYKNYNRYIQDNKNKMDVYVKATKKEKQKYQMFLTREETHYWKDFPRKKKFYHQSLHQIKELFDFNLEGKQQSQTVLSSSVIEVRDIDEMVKIILDYLPFSSRKYCQQFNLEHQPYFTEDPLKTFDELTQSLRMFDTDDVRNWQILGFVVTILVSDVLAILLEHRNARAGVLLPIQISQEVTNILIKYCKRFSQNNMVSQGATEDELEEYTIVDMIFDQVQFTWAHQIYSRLSQISKDHFDACLKMVQLPLQINLKKASEDEVMEATQEIFFCRYLVIVPTDIKMGDKVLNLLEKFLHVLNSKASNNAEEEFKHGMLATLKYLIENLCFYDVQKQNKTISLPANVVPAKGLKFEPQAMQMLENRVSKIYFQAELLSKKEGLREYAHYLMASILKVETEDFVEQNLSKFLTQIKFNQFFQSKKTYSYDLKLINQLYYSGTIQLQKYKAWKPHIYTKSILLVDDRSAQVVTPVVKNVSGLDSISHGRKIFMPKLQQNQLPQGLSQPNEQPRCIIQSVPELFSLVFNPKLLFLHNQGCSVDFTHWQFLEQATYDDFDFISKSGIELLLDQRYSEKHLQMVNLALKLANFVLNPLSHFRERYLELCGGITSYKGSRLAQQMQTMSKIVCTAIKDILQSQNKKGESPTGKPPAMEGTAIRRVLDFFKRTELKSLCNDQMQVMWSRVNTDLLLVKSAAISKEMKKQNLGKFHLQEQKRLISFEDLNEIEKMDFKYSDMFLNLLADEIAATTGQGVDATGKVAVWDRKKEEFIRHRLLCYLSEVENMQTNSSPTTSFVGITVSTNSKQETTIYRQNTTNYCEIAPNIKEQLKQLKLILKMIHFLPEMHEYFLDFPLRSLIKDQRQTLLDKVKLPNTDGKQKLGEVERLLPYLILCLDFNVSAKAMKAVTKMMLFGNLSVRISLIDQMIYFVKELMLESTDDHQLSQFLQIILNMVRVWHSSEITKVQTTQPFKHGQKLLNSVIIDLDDYDQHASDKSKTMYAELLQNLQIFDFLDMISMITICNRSSLVRSIGCLLLAETGKLKRLLVLKDKHKHSVSDIYYFQKDQIQESLVQKLCLFYSFTGEGFRPQAYFRQLISKDISFWQFMVDNFEYSKAGLWESLVRDIQVLYIGDLTRIWKENLIKHSKYGGVILNFIQQIANRTLQLYENKSDGHATVGVNQIFDVLKNNTVQLAKDSVGFNILLAAVLSNLTKSHSNTNFENELEEGDGFSMSTNTILDEVKTLLSLLEANFNQVHKISFGSFYPARMATSNVLLSFMYYMQTPQVVQKSFENLKEIFLLKRIEFEKTTQEKNQSQAFAQNCMIFYSLLSINANDQFLNYLYDQVSSDGTSTHLQHQAHILINILDGVDFANDNEGKKKSTVKICLAHAVCVSVKRLKDFSDDLSQAFDSTLYLPEEYQVQLLKETKAQYNTIAKSPEMEWLTPKIKQIWYCLLSFEAIFSHASKLQLDLKFLISLEQEGFTDALKYFKYFSQQEPALKSAASEQGRINEVKLLIQHVYTFYSCSSASIVSNQKDFMGQSNQPSQMLKNLQLVKKQPPDSSFFTQRDARLREDSAISLNQFMKENLTSQKTMVDMKIHQKNIYFKCFINQVVDIGQMQKALEQLNPQGANFDAVYTQVVNSVFKHSKLSLGQKVKKFTQANMHSKYFLMSLLISLNSVDKVFIEKSKVLTLALLPLMFSDASFDSEHLKINYRQIVEEKIASQAANMKQLVNFENKAFYQFIKRVFVDEELFNMQFNFEKYFSISGFLRDILNEIIKLQSGEISTAAEDKGKDMIPPKMLLKVLDIITYFFSGNLDLRRAPHAHNVVLEPKQREFAQVPAQSKHNSSFIFANLIDYKSFEFLSKLYKVSEKLVDFDNEMLVMNMWYKICENRPHNFEILAKFLVHNLSSFIMKLKTSSQSTVSPGNSSAGKTNEPDAQSQLTAMIIKSSSGTNTDSLQSQSSQDIAYGIEYEKQKRFSLSIFNYIKARTQQVDLRNSLNLASLSWSQSMIKLVIHAQLNLQSKYALEKIKLKKILQQLHSEINHSGIRQLIMNRDHGVEEQLNQLLMVGSDNIIEGDQGRHSVTMEKLLQSQTFLSTFGVKNQQDSSTIKQMLFIMSRQMSDHFHECTPDSQIVQLPDLVIKYCENALILIANEAERLQIIKFTLKEEITVTILILLLVADLASQNSNNDINRCYFIFDLINKLAMSISGIQKFLRLQTLSIEQFTSMTSEEDLLMIFNYRNIFDVFGLFTQVFFKILHNTVCIPTVQSFMLKFWQEVLYKVQNLNIKTAKEKPKPTRLNSITDMETIKPLYTRKQSILMLQGCFNTLHLVSLRQTKQQQSKSVKSVMGNFVKQVQCLFEYIQPTSTKAFAAREIADSVLFDPDVAFPINMTFWLAYLCLEAATIVQSKSNLDNMLLDEADDKNSFKFQLLKLQEIAIISMRRIIEESEFFKTLLNLQSLSQEFFSYSISLTQRKNSLLSLLFVALENPKCTKEAYQILIVSIRIQDHGLLTYGEDQLDLAKDELHRLLLLLPFFNQQFLGEPLCDEDDSLRQSSTSFPSPRAMIQLLKKSMLSISIDKKKDMESILDEIQQLNDQSDSKAINQRFANLINATVESCIALNHHQVAVECIRTFKSIQDFSFSLTKESSANRRHLVIEHQILAAAVSEIEKVLQSHQIIEDVPSIYCQSKDFFSVGPNAPPFILGEQTITINEEIRSLYFGIKNIVLLEIHHQSKDLQIHDVKQFFGFHLSVHQNRVSIPTNSSNLSGELQRPGSLHDNESLSSKYIQKLAGSRTITQIKTTPPLQNTSPSLANLKAQQAIQQQNKVTPFRVFSAINTAQPFNDYNNLKHQNSETQLAQKHLYEESKQNQVQVLEQDEGFTREQQQEQLSQILFEEDSNEGANEGDQKIEEALAPARFAAKSFAENVINEDQRVKLDGFYPQQEFEQEPDSQDSIFKHEIEGLIGTFSKPKQAQKAQTEDQYNDGPRFAQEVDKSPRQMKGLRGEVPAPKMGGLVITSQAISSIAVPKGKNGASALIPGFVAGKAVELERDIDNSFTYSEPDANPRKHFATVNKDDFNFKDAIDQRSSPQRLQTPWITSDYRKTQELLNTDRVITGRKDPMFQTDKEQNKKAKKQFSSQDDLSTPKKSSELDSMLIKIINDQDKFFELEEFLSDVKGYDMDILAFYVKVMEFKKESSQNNAALAAGLIIDNYLSEDADYYIGNSYNEDVINKLITNYEHAVINQYSVPKDLFDCITIQVKEELTPFLREFSKH